MKRIILKKGEEGRVKAGHPWVYDNEVDQILVQGPGGARNAELEPGETADVESYRKEYLGRAFVNPRSKIIARIYSPSKEGADKGFFKRRVRECLKRRLAGAGLSFSVPGFNAPGGAFYKTHSFRRVFGEADLLPARIVDRFAGWPLGDIAALEGGDRGEKPLTLENAASLGPCASWLSVQFLCWGMEKRREQILDALEEVLAAPIGVGGECLGRPQGIVERSTAKVRELEGLPPREGLVRGAVPAEGIAAFEGGFPFVMDPLGGQKTGYFLDQGDNRRRAASLAAGLAQEKAAAGEAKDSSLRVLDACSYTGGFGVHIARMVPGARVTCLDISAEALEGVRKNAALNGAASRVETLEADVFDYLRAAWRGKERFDLIILDPPAFAKSRSALEGALRGYREINQTALRLLRPGGVLVSCSCSQALDERRFKQMILAAGSDADTRLVQLGFYNQAPDHPILLGYDESLYLKCGFYLVL
jgi:23S rRNA (cytosine1962-C5)-methyltransferase